MMKSFLLLNLIWIAFIQAAVYYNWYTIEKRKVSPNHAVNFSVALLAGAALCLWLYHDIRTYLILSIFYVGLQYWVLFNLELNYFRGKRGSELLHLGEASWFDRLEAKFKNPGATLGLKLVLLVMIGFILMDLK